MTKKYFLFIITLAFSCFLHAQDDEKKSIAQLQSLLKTSNSDLTRSNAMLDLALGYILKPGEFANDLDSAHLLIGKAEVINKEGLGNKEVEAKIYYTYSNLFREKGDQDKGKLFCQKSIEIYKKLSPTDAFGEAYFELANYYGWDDNEYLPKRDAFSKALAVFKNTGNKSKQGFALKNIADLDYTKNYYGQALVELHQALDIYKSISYKKLQGVYDLLGAVSNNIGDFPTAVKYGLLAVQACEALKDTSLQLCTVYYRLSVSYDNWSRNKSPEALVYLRKAFAVALKYKDPKSIIITIASLASTLKNNGRTNEAVTLLLSNRNNIRMEDRMDSIYIYSHYVSTFNSANTKALAKEAVDVLIRLLPDGPGTSDQYIEYGFRTLVDYYISEHQPIPAKKYALLNFAYSMTSPEDRPSYLLAFRTKALADSAGGNFASAFTNQRIYSDLKDSLFNEKQSFQFTQMKAAFETEKKDDELKVLQAENRLKNTEIKNFRQVRNSIIAAAVFLLALFYTGYRYKQRSNARLQKKQEEINHQNDILKNTVDQKNQLLTEKEWLVKEIHHRVKNNLQIVISLLNTQSHYINNEEAIAAITESRHRMEAMSLIHQKLYQSEDATSVNIKNYIRELTEYLEASFVTGDRIIFTLDLEPLEIDIAQAIPLGLILNETITNSIKYAFADNEQGIIKITMHKKDKDDVMLEIKDNGRGLPNHFDIAKSNSMGMRLITGLAKQIDAVLAVTGERGVTTTIIFKQHFITTDI